MQMTSPDGCDILQLNNIPLFRELFAFWSYFGDHAELDLLAFEEECQFVHEFVVFFCGSFGHF
jgi:hypothetical protein